MEIMAFNRTECKAIPMFFPVATGVIVSVAAFLYRNGCHVLREKEILKMRAVLLPTRLDKIIARLS
jgi:hypothetical protein